MPSIFTVIPTFNRRDILERCLHALEQQTVKPKVFVSDSASADGTPGMVREKFPHVTMCAGTTDLWWTGATNLGLREALETATDDDFILCINDDTEFGPDYVAKLLASAGNQYRRLVGSVAIDAHGDNLIIDGGVRLNWYTAARQRRNLGRPLDDFPPGHEELADVLPGRGMLVPVRAFRELGLLAERQLPHYAADYEFSARCARAGYALVCSYDAVIRSRTDLTGKHSAHGFSLREFYQLFFDRRSSSMLSDRAALAWLTRKNPLQAASFLFFSITRLLGHYIRTVVKQRRKAM